MKQTLAFQLYGTRRDAAVFFVTLALFVAGLLGLIFTPDADSLGLGATIVGGAMFGLNFGATLLSKENRRLRGEL
ncbi:hypothetical protein [Hymenobacter glacieicola]|uniref:Uncharacterized protein n=1 Tax=Hymenobacter glacieicola TaxID=1562124 RepID=A0ABQ1X9P1_9BACT|nr:hypothetical protein [Hymenobacter glacieicola]GGG60718.1 hypothetical protein GCM10011378_40930 [Hymenobacter glacieicola]